MDYDSESGGGGGAMGPSSMQGLLMQNSELRRKLEEQNDSYKSKLAAYQEGQTKQTEIVKKLQQKLLQYKKKCGELETTLHERARESDATRVELQTVQDQLSSRVDDAENKLRRA